MAPGAPVSPGISARIIHGSLMLGVVLFSLVAWYVAGRTALPVAALPDRRVLYIGLFLVSATLFGGAMFTANRLVPPARGSSQDEWWRVNLGKAILVWALVEAPAILGTVAYLLTRDFRTLIATFTGLLFFGAYRPSRLFEH
ncbi:MAG TPA: hypothetical protein VFT84_08530 [Gemmatimonadales bacterium]|nr:hypothetical protein [Gemmatimonadales bacterium]